jgi:serine/threonine protein kinase
MDLEKKNKKIKYSKSNKKIEGEVFIKKYHIESIGVNGELLMLNIKHPNLMEYICNYEYKQENALNPTNNKFIEFHYKYYDKNNWIDLIDIYNYNNPNNYLISEIYNNKKEISLQLIKVVNFLHNKNIVHRDIKLDNILYNSNNKYIILCDFEYCTKIIYNGRNEKFIIGTPLYYPPEMLNKSIQQIDYKKVDIWNIGFTIYVLFFNKIPDANKIYWNRDENLLSSSIIVKKMFISMLNLYPNERKSLDKIIKLEYFN